MSASRRPARVAILLATCNGVPHLAEQLASIAAQRHRDWTLYVSDDGSADATGELVADFAQRHDGARVHLGDGPCRGFVANYLSLTCRADVEGDCFAFCDQDDIWEADHLSRAVGWLAGVDAGVPALHCSRTRLIDARGRVLGLSAPCPRPPSFANALVQSLAGANTMVFNRAALELLRRAGPAVAAASHDWWLYLLVTGANGRVRYDPEPTVRYRQHTDNAQGTNRGVRARARRCAELLGGRMRGWNDAHCAALDALGDALAPEHRARLARFRRLRAQRGLAALRAFREAGLYRQKGIDNVALMLAAALGRL
ncbi:glycosyltransferase family 2 protein [Pseudazoarcus pumilus]|nr:glycosyltransferase family 2 protein [Pseudazoarcus pumilus]